jgi:predicted metal-dependent hydrolase
MKELFYKEVGLVVFKKNARSRRITIRVKPNSPVTVTMPLRSSYKEAENVLADHFDWVLKQQVKMKKLEVNKLITLDNSFQVRNKTLMFLPSDSVDATLLISDNKIEIHLPRTWKIEEPSTQAVIQKAMVKALRTEAKAYLPQRTRTLASIKGIVINNIRIKNIKTRWGSCSTKKNINLSLYLMLLPDALIDYVIFHELAHIKHQNHSASFWNHLEKIYPGAKKLDKQMKNYHIPFV